MTHNTDFLPTANQVLLLSVGPSQLSNTQVSAYDGLCSAPMWRTMPDFLTAAGRLSQGGYDSLLLTVIQQSLTDVATTVSY